MARPDVPDVSVIIPAYNAMPYLERGLESVVGQTLGTDRMEVVVVDDGSTDGTGEAVDAWAERYPDLFRVVHAAQGSGGPATPRNTGLDLARGRYVFFLDADDYLGDEALERLLAAAEENSADIVMGRMRGATGRSVPASMFMETDLDADLFESRIYWTLAALKLFRRDLLEDNGLRFPTHFPNCSDQPFTATAYFRARRIAVLGDYDYYYAVLRDDGNHVTRSGSVANRLDVVETMCDLVAREVAEPDKRAPLLARHFQIDLRRVMTRLPHQPRPDQEALLERIATLVRTHLGPALRSRLTPDLRVAYELAGRQLLDETLHAVEQAVGHASYDISVEGDRAYAHLPYFRDPAVSVPDELYDVTDRVRSTQSLTSFACSGGTLRITGTAALRNVVGASDVEVVVTSRRDEELEYAAPAATSDDGGFEAVVDLLTLADGRPLPRGPWDVDLRVSQQGVSRRRRLRDDRSGTLVTEPSLGWAGTGGKKDFTVGAFLTGDGKLSLDVGGRRSKLGNAFEDWSVAWDGTDLVIGCRTVARVGAALAVAVGNGAGDVRAFPAQVDGATVSGRVPVAELPDGTWSVRLRVEDGSTRRAVTVPAQPELPPVRWRRALQPVTAVSVAPKPTLTLEVGVTGAAGAVRRAAQGVRGGLSRT